MCEATLGTASYAILHISCFQEACLCYPTYTYACKSLVHTTVLTGVKAALAYKPHPDFEQKKKKKKGRKKK